MIAGRGRGTPRPRTRIFRRFDVPFAGSGANRALALPRKDQQWPVPDACRSSCCSAPPSSPPAARCRSADPDDAGRGAAGHHRERRGLAGLRRGAQGADRPGRQGHDVPVRHDHGAALLARAAREPSPPRRQASWRSRCCGRGRPAQSDRIGSLVVNPGGPGASGIDTAVYLSFGAEFGGIPDEISRRFDLVGFDPRGVGRSSPVDCISDADLDAFFGFEPDPVAQADFDELVAINRRMALGCASEVRRHAARSYSTEQAARDMDAVRAGGRRREADLPGLLVRHAARRHVRPALPAAGAGAGARRRGRPAGQHGRRVGEPGQGLRAGVHQLRRRGAAVRPRSARSRRTPARP